MDHQHGKVLYFVSRDELERYSGTNCNGRDAAYEKPTGEGWDRAWEFYKKADSGNINVSFYNWYSSDMVQKVLDSFGLNPEESYWKSNHDMFMLAEMFWGLGVNIMIRRIDESRCTMFLSTKGFLQH